MMTGHGVDGLANVLRAGFPALGASAAEVVPVVAPVFGLGHHKTDSDQRVVEQFAACGAVRQDDQRPLGRCRRRRGGKGPALLAPWTINAPKVTS